MPNVDLYAVYEHWRPDTGKCFYVGKGRRSRPWQITSGRSGWHRNVQKKLAEAGLLIEVKILQDGLSNEDAIALEINRIAFYGLENLVNLTAGGEGRAGLVVSADTREKLRRANTGKKCSEETKKKLSVFNTGRVRGPREHPVKQYKNATQFGKGHVPANKGKSPPQELRERLSQALMGNTPWNKGISPSEGVRRKISQSLVGRPSPLKGRKRTEPMAQESREKIRAALKGRPRPPDVAAKIAAANRNRAMLKRSIQHGLTTLAPHH